MADYGVVYVTTNDAFDQFAAISIVSLRRFYKGPIVVLTDAERGVLTRIRDKYQIGINVVKIPKEQEASRFLKSRCALHVKFERGLFIDADTFVARPVDPLWETVDNAFISMSMARTHKTIGEGAAGARHAAKPWFAREMQATVAELGEDHPHYSSGAFVWRKSPEITQLFEEYYREWLRFQAGDQFALMRAMHKRKIKPAVLPEPYHHIRAFDPKKTIICHVTRRRMDLYKYVKPLIDKSIDIIDPRRWSYARDTGPKPGGEKWNPMI